MFIGLWTKQSQYWEQPDVIFRNNLILEVLDKNGVSSQYSTLPVINDEFMNPMSPPTIKVSQIDKDSNGKIDQFKI